MRHLNTAVKLFLIITVSSLMILVVLYSYVWIFLTFLPAFLFISVAYIIRRLKPTTEDSNDDESFRKIISQARNTVREFQSITDMHTFRTKLSDLDNQVSNAFKTKHSTLSDTDIRNLEVALTRLKSIEPVQLECWFNDQATNEYLASLPYLDSSGRPFTPVEYIKNPKCQQCGENADFICSCGEWICCNCQVGEHPEYKYPYCKGCYALNRTRFNRSTTRG